MRKRLRKILEWFVGPIAEEQKLAVQYHDYNSMKHIDYIANAYEESISLSQRCIRENDAIKRIVRDVENDVETMKANLRRL